MKSFENADEALVKLQDNYRYLNTTVPGYILCSKYKFMESRLSQARQNLKAKLPDLKKTLETVQFLESKKGQVIQTNFELSDNVFASAQITKPSSVCLWLGVVH